MENITRKKYGKLTVKYLAGRKTQPKKRGHTVTQYWMCECSCGTMEVFKQSILTGRKARQCSKCNEKRADLIAKNTTCQQNIERAYASRPDGIDRSKLPGFQKFFRQNPYMFWDTFGIRYTDENAKVEFDKLNFEPAKSQEEKICRTGRPKQSTPPLGKNSIAISMTSGTRSMASM